MRRLLLVGLMMVSLVACRGKSETDEAAVCADAGNGQLRCSIAKLSDCEAIRDYPYARSLFCPAAFSAAQTMVAAVAESIGAKIPTKGFFHYYQTLADPDAPADDQSQTTVACLETRTPWGSHQVVGAGAPLCRLIAYVTSPGPTGLLLASSGNPIPAALRVYPDYFKRLVLPGTSSLASEFHVGSAFDRVVRDLGATARPMFLADYPSFAADALYDPADWRRDPQYHGISGGGGAGWGGEIVVERGGAEPEVWLAFGGGGGGGMTSSRTFGATSSALGAGGGGGVQFADGYRNGDRSYDGLGLGAGVGSDEPEVQYSYSDYEGSERPPQPPHEDNPAVVAEFVWQLANLIGQLAARRDAGDNIAVRGGGGMGGGAEYLKENGEEYEPHALSTQAGFQFRYEIDNHEVERTPARDLDANQAGGYALLGEFYRQATARAYDACGRNYSNYGCMCPATHAAVMDLMRRELGAAADIPTWLRQSHCPGDT